MGPRTSNGRIRICRLGVSSSAHFKRGAAGTMERLTPRYKRGDWPTVNTRAGRQRWTETEDGRQTPRLAARSGFDTYLMMSAFPHLPAGNQTPTAPIQMDRSRVSAALWPLCAARFFAHVQRPKVPGPSPRFTKADC